MIITKNDLIEYLNEDKKALGFKKKRPSIYGNEIWKFQIALRHYEYWTNVNRSAVSVIMKFVWKVIYHHYSIMLGFDIPPNVCGKGLEIHHFGGGIIINGKAKIGDYCNIQQGVNIGMNHNEDEVPTIGCKVYIGPGVKIFGNIYIADGCIIGAGSVVNKSFYSPNHVIVGNPAKDIGEK